MCTFQGSRFTWPDGSEGSQRGSDEFQKNLHGLDYGSQAEDHGPHAA
jgi:hypothetical protein